MRKSIALVAAALALAIAGSSAFAGERIRIATEGAYAPFNMKNTKGQLVGFDVDIAKALCAKMDANCSIVAQDWDGIIPGLMARKYDAIIASMSITAEREKSVSFTNPYYSNYLRFVAPNGSTLKTNKAGLEGKTIGAQRATISAQYLEDHFGKVVKIKLYDTQEAAYLDLKAGRIDAMLTDVYPAYDWMRKNKGFSFIGKQIDINDKIGIAVRKSDSALRMKFNKALAEIFKDGTYAKINKRYFPFSIR